MSRSAPPEGRARNRTGPTPARSSPADGSARGPRSPLPEAFGPEDFPGCEAIRLPAAELDRYEGRLEVWDARTETAWKVREPTSIYHERPPRIPDGAAGEAD